MANEEAPIQIECITEEQAEACRENPAYPGLYGKLLGLLQIADRVEHAKSVEAPNGEMTALAQELKKMLSLTHPALPVLAEEVRIENPDLEIPLVFKLAYPKIKVLNSLLSEAGVDELMARVGKAFNRHFARDLTLLGADFKAGKAILKLSNDGGWDAFKNRTDEFQGILEELIQSFATERGVDLSLTERPKMVFGATPWEEGDFDSGRPVSSSLVRRFLLAEQVCNMTLRRVVPEEARKTYTRGLAIKLSENEYFENLDKDLKVALDLIQSMFEKGDTVGGVFDQSFVGATAEETLPVPSFNFLSAWRKGKVGQEFPNLSEVDQKEFAKFLAILNTVDVLKPYLQVDAPQFLLRLEILAQLLKTPNELEDLDSALSRSLKAPEGDSVVLTRFGFGSRLLQASRVEDSTGKAPSVFMCADVVGLGANNLLGCYADLLTYLGKKAVNQEEARDGILLGAGDRCTELLQLLRAALAAVVSALDASGGDELGALIQAEKISMVERALCSVPGVPVRRVYYDVSGWKGRSVEDLAHLWTVTTLRAGEALEEQKRQAK